MLKGWSAGPTAVSSYSPADQRALGGDWLGGAGATKDPFCSFRG